MNEATNPTQSQSQKEQDIKQAWIRYNRKNKCSAPSKDEVFEMREKGKI